MEATRDSARSESPFGVLGTTLVLLVLVAAVGLVAGTTLGLAAGEVDGAARTEELFQDGAPPFGLALAEATRLPGGETMLRYAPSAEPGPEGAPDELVAFRFTSRGAARAAFEAGRSDEDARSIGRRVVEWEEEPKEPWHATLLAGELAWSRWRADYRIERSFRADGTWRDSTRLDLCRADRNLVLFAQHPPNVPASKDWAEELARSVRMEE